jgi:hypothetical protein
VVCHLVALRIVVLRCPRTHSGRRPGPADGRCAPSAFHGRPRTGCAAGRFPGLTRAAEWGVHPCVRLAARWFPRDGRGRAGALMGQGGGSGERDDGRAGGAGAGRPRVHSRLAWRPSCPRRKARRRAPSSRRAPRR